MYQEWQDRHGRRAFVYLPEVVRPPRSSRKAREQHAVRLLAFHFTGALLPVSQTAWLDGALTRLPVNKVEQALADILVPIMMGVEPADLA
jgi:hypothetical protein